MVKRAVHVLPRGNEWIIKLSGSQKPYRVKKTMGEAIAAGRRVAMNQRSGLIVHRQDGTPRSKDWFGSDPFPPKANG